MDLLNLPIFISLFLALYTLVLFFIAFFDDDIKVSKRLKKYMKVAIIVPAYNEEDTISGTLDSLLNLNYPKSRVKIYAVDDGSSDATWNVMQKYNSDKRVVLLHKENGGKASAMNYAFEKIDKDTDIVGILDADSFVKEDALLEIVRAFRARPELQAMTPAIKIYNPNAIVRFLQNAEYNLSVWLRKAFDNLGIIFIIPGPFSFYRRDALEIAGPWKHAHGTEDLEMGLRFQKLGFKVGNTTRAVVYTVSPDTFYKLYKQRLRWTFGFLNNVIDYKYMFFGKSNRALGWFALPVSLISVLFSVYIFAYSFYHLLHFIYKKIEYWYNFGFSFSFSLPDLFFVNVNSVLWLALVTVFVAAAASFVGDRASGDRTLRLRDVLSYVLLYGFVAPVWLISALVKTYRKSEVKWVKVNK